MTTFCKSNRQKFPWPNLGSLLHLCMSEFYNRIAKTPSGKNWAAFPPHWTKTNDVTNHGMAKRSPLNKAALLLPLEHETEKSNGHYWAASPLFYDKTLFIECSKILLEKLGCICPSFMMELWRSNSLPKKSFGTIRQHCPLFNDQILGIKWPNNFVLERWAAFAPLLWWNFEHRMAPKQSRKYWAALPPFYDQILAIRWPKRFWGSKNSLGKLSSICPSFVMELWR